MNVFWTQCGYCTHELPAVMEIAFTVPVPDKASVDGGRSTQSPHSLWMSC